MERQPVHDRVDREVADALLDLLPQRLVAPLLPARLTRLPVRIVRARTVPAGVRVGRTAAPGVGRLRGPLRSGRLFAPKGIPRRAAVAPPAGVLRLRDGAGVARVVAPAAGNEVVEAAGPAVGVGRLRAGSESEAVLEAVLAGDLRPLRRVRLPGRQLQMVRVVLQRPLQVLRHHRVQLPHDVRGQMPGPRVLQHRPRLRRQRDREERDHQRQHHALAEAERPADVLVELGHAGRLDPPLQHAGEAERGEREDQVRPDHHDPVVQRRRQRHERTDRGRDRLGEHEAQHDAGDRRDLEDRPPLDPAEDREDQNRSDEQVVPHRRHPFPKRAAGGPGRLPAATAEQTRSGRSAAIAGEDKPRAQAADRSLSTRRLGVVDRVPAQTPPLSRTAAPERRLCAGGLKRGASSRAES